jgi:hypothetical protein
MGLWRKITYLGLLTTVATAILVAFHWHDLSYPACEGCDASSYGLMAYEIKKHGVVAPWSGSDVRAYGYPLFVSLVSREQDLSLPMYGYFTPNVALAQSALYIARCLVLFFVMYPTSRTAAWCCAIGLLCNPFVLNYVPLRLTEGLNATILISLTAIVVTLALYEHGHGRSSVLMSVGGAIAGFAIILRPANIAVAGAWLGFILLHNWPLNKKGTARILYSLSGFAIPLFPQLILNAIYHGAITPFPTFAIDTNFAVLVVKLETNLSEIGPLQLFYRNPFLDQKEASEFGWRIYLWNPLAGVPTMFAHVFNSINHGYFFTYVYDRQPWYYFIMNVANHLMIFAAAVSAIFLSISYYRQSILLGSRLGGLWLFLFLVFILTCGVNSVSHAETRFGLAVFCLSGPLATWGVYKWMCSGFRTKVIAFGFCALYVLAAKLFSDWMLTLCCWHFTTSLPSMRIS